MPSVISYYIIMITPYPIYKLCSVERINITMT